MQCFAGLALLSVLWFLCGFSLCFSETDLGLVGGLEHVGLAGIGLSPLAAAPTIPGVLFVAFQGMFAAITPLLCTGAFAERLKFEAFLTFILAWSLIVYYPLCHWVWGGGWLARLGVVDFAGGIVIHTSAGVASLVSAVMLGPRHDFGSTSAALAPHNLPMAATGAGLLWFGWFSFNAGSSLGAGGLAASTMMTTHIAGSAGAVAWLVLDWCFVGRPTFVGAINGAIGALAGVTPASGFITPASGFVVGLLCGVGSYGGVLLFKERLGIDDALDVSSVHGLTGVIGSLLIGVYATSDVNPDGPNGVLYDGGLAQLGLQALGVVGRRLGGRRDVARDGGDGEGVPRRADQPRRREPRARPLAARRVVVSGFDGAAVSANRRSTCGVCGVCDVTICGTTLRELVLTSRGPRWFTPPTFFSAVDTSLLPRSARTCCLADDAGSHVGHR